MALFYADAILSKKGPLARVWLAAHYERKLSKAQTLQTDIGQSTKAIESRPLALRISGQLLLGVCRIYSRKAKYLLDDCNEALVKIKLAFRPGVVDMTDEQLAVPANAITLQLGDGFNLDLFGDTWDFDPSRKGTGRHMARESDINLPMQEDFIPTMDDGDFTLNMDDLGFLGVDFGENPFDDSMEVEMPRDAAPARSARESIASALQLRSDQAGLDDISMRTKDAGDFDDVDLNLGDIGDFTIDFGEGMADGGDVFPPIVSSRHSSPLTEMEPQTPGDVELEETPTKKAPKKRKIKERKQVVDSVTELNDRRAGAQNGTSFTKADVSAITTTHGYLSDSVAVMRYLEIQADPLAHFFPTKITDEGSFYSVAPPGLAPEIADMFLFPATQGAGQKRKGVNQNERASKRPRLGSEGIDDVEQLRARAGSAAPSAAQFEIDGGFDGFADDSGFIPADESMPNKDYQFQVDDSINLGKGSNASPTKTVDLEDGPRVYADEDCAVAMFDTQPMTQDTTISSAAQSPSKEKDEGVNKDGYSRNTVKAINLLKQEFSELETGDKSSLGFSGLTEGGTRRAASSFFFELLVLGTRDCVKLKQPKAFSDINISGKAKLWQRQEEV